MTPSKRAWGTIRTMYDQGHDEGPDDADADLFGPGADVMDCPRCGHEIYAEAERCPSCGVWLTMKHPPIKGEHGGHRWQAVVVALMVLLMILFIVAGVW